MDTDAGEQCDDGNKINTDSCTNLCKTPVCGDGAVNGSEQCDRAGQNGSVCTPGVGGTCTYCSATCETKTVVGAVCGDGNVDAGEQCDDGNKNNNDSCSNACVALTCGDGMISGAEQCDDGADNGKVCTP